MLKQDYGFGEVVDIFNEIGNKHNKPYEYDSRTPDKTNTKNKILTYLKIIDDQLIDTFSTPTIIRKIKGVNYKGYVHDKFHAEELIQEKL